MHEHQSASNSCWTSINERLYLSSTCLAAHAPPTARPSPTPARTNSRPSTPTARPQRAPLSASPDSTTSRPSTLPCSEPYRSSRSPPAGDGEARVRVGVEVASTGSCFKCMAKPVQAKRLLLPRSQCRPGCLMLRCAISTAPVPPTGVGRHVAADVAAALGPQVQGHAVALLCRGAGVATGRLLMIILYSIFSIQTSVSQSGCPSAHRFDKSVGVPSAGAHCPDAQAGSALWKHPRMTRHVCMPGKATARPATCLPPAPAT